MGGAALPKLTLEENAIIRTAFTDNEGLLKSMRALFFGLGATDQEKEQVRAAFLNPDLLRIIRAKFLPVLSKETPIGQVQDVWLGAEQMVFGVSKDTIEQAIKFKAEAIGMTEMALTLLTDPTGEQIDLTVKPYSAATDPLAIGLLARNQFIRHIEQQLVFIKIISEQKIETPKETASRAAKDSTK